VFARAPELGRVKSRLAAAIGRDSALRIYETLLDHTIGIATHFDFSIHLEGESSLILPVLDRAGIREPYLKEQTGENLGDRMIAAILSELDLHDRVILVGSDIPDLSTDVISQCDRLLLENDLIFGPAHDGGFYLLGVHKGADTEEILRSLFSGMEWSHNSVLAELLARARDLEKNVTLGPVLQDLDNASDLANWLSENQGSLKSRIQKTVPDVRVIIPVLNEAENLPVVIRGLTAVFPFRQIICVDNGSTDGSAEIARSLGAHVLESARGYGNACLAGMDWVKNQGGADVILFADADCADKPQDAVSVVGAVLRGADFALVERIPEEEGALLPHARFGNWLSTSLIALFFGHSYRDLGPLRAIRFASLLSLEMEDRNFGWTVEMQIRAVRRGLKIVEIPGGYRKRLYGASKVSATIMGSIRAGLIILRTVGREVWRDRGASWAKRRKRNHHPSK